MAMMTDKISRREFVVTTAAGVVAATAGTHTEAPAIMTQARVQPVVVASANGHQFKNGGPKTAVEQAFAMMTSGKDVLESLIAGVTIVELDPEETSVGYGGLPNADGVVQLDSCCMHGPLRRAGGVAAIEGVRTPAQVAYKVMQETDNHLIAGKGAQEFARGMGFKIEDDLNTERSRATEGIDRHPVGAPTVGSTGAGGVKLRARRRTSARGRRCADTAAPGVTRPPSLAAARATWWS